MFGLLKKKNPTFDRVPASNRLKVGTVPASNRIPISFSGFCLLSSSLELAFHNLRPKLKKIVRCENPVKICDFEAYDQ